MEYEDIEERVNPIDRVVKIIVWFAIGYAVVMSIKFIPGVF